MSKVPADCDYAICACASANDGHCQYCCQPLSDHTLIPKSELQEIERRMKSAYEGEQEAVARLAALTALRERAEVLLGIHTSTDFCLSMCSVDAPPDRHDEDCPVPLLRDLLALLPVPSGTDQ
jgi:hypothetical protein